MKSALLFVVLTLMVGCGGPEERCLVSSLCGTIVSNGEPVIGATVTRRYYSHWYNEHVESVTHTDAKGYFQFDDAWKKALVNLLHQPVIEEEVIVQSKGNVYTVLSLTKMNYDCFGELDDIRLDDPQHGKDRLSKKDGKLYFTYDVALDKVPIGRRS